ncbi:MULTISPECIES: dethiobiotin synthase [unclassified Sphingomonas]|uniref:dethiobiotin synthase n=1 Tax=unclassified Sphingomonas TaxID=196159 RepID=UPI00082D63F3|nr:MULTISPECIES: dethiobiotin synthase [unclassified Sphingomonas]
MRLVVTGTDTDVGKTMVAAMLVQALGALYWKPVQSGLADGSDSDRVAALTGVAHDRILPEAYRLTEPLSPHRAAELDGVTIDAARLVPPPHDPLVVEGAGGALVPVTRDLLYADLFARWALPVVIVARTALGTINHSLLTIEALRARAVTILGIAFNGDANADNEATICAIGGVRRLGRLPRLNAPSPDALAQAFATHFDAGDFA